MQKPLLLFPAIILPLLLVCSCRKNDHKPIPVLSVSLYAGSATVGAANGPVKSATFNNPQGIVADAAGNLYIADSGNNLIRKISSDGMVSTFAGDGKPGDKDGTGAAAEFNTPFKIAIDASGNLYITEQNPSIRKITAAGVVSSIPYSMFLSEPSGLAPDGLGNLYVADTFDDIIQKVTADGKLTNYAGSGEKGIDNGPAPSATFSRPIDLVIDHASNMYIADAENYVIREISSAGVVSTFAGNGTQGAVNGAAATASFGYPYALILGNNGNLFVVDQGNNGIRMIKPDGTVSNYAGSGSAGAKDGPVLSATFDTPQGIAMDAMGTFYVTEGGTNNDIRKICLK